jgi:hypothetical protein
MILQISQGGPDPFFDWVHDKCSRKQTLQKGVALLRGKVVGEILDIMPNANLYFVTPRRRWWRPER